MPGRPRVAHALRVAGETSGIPDRMIFVDTETYSVPTDDPARTVNMLRLGWLSYVDDRYGTPHRLEFTQAWEFWDQVERRTQTGRRLWVFAHFADYDLAVLDWHGQMVEQRGWTISKLIIGKPLCIDLKQSKRTVRLVDTMNWFNTSVRVLGDTLGFPKGDFDYSKIKDTRPGTDEWDQLSGYCRRDVEILERAMGSWMDLVRSRDLGPFAFTAAGQAFTAYRRRFLPDAPVVVPPAAALPLERASYAGGLTAVWFKGEVREPVRVADVTSMYPYVMREHRYPRALAGTYRAGVVTPSKLLSIIDGGRCVVAQLHVDVPAGEELVPVKGERLEYPCGRFTTTLTTPEVETALRAGAVREVGAVQVYDADDLFTRWVDEMFALRQEYLDAGNTVYADLVKLGLLNSLYGKFGQYHYEWDQIDPAQWGCWGSDVVMVDGIARPLRWLGDYCEMRSDKRIEPNQSFPAIAAHVTAYARTLLRAYRDVCGRGDVFYADTDSLFMSEDGYARGVQAGVILDRKQLGMLYSHPEKDRYSGAVIHGLKVYTLRDGGAGKGDVVKMKGVRKDAVKVGEGRYRVRQIRGMLGAVRERDLGRAVTIDTKRDLVCITDPDSPKAYRKGRVTASGWVVPNQRTEATPTW